MRPVAPVSSENAYPVNTYQSDSITQTTQQPVQRVQTYSAEQLRYWKIRENRKMFISDTHTLPLRDVTQLSEAYQTRADLILPVRSRVYGENDWFLFLAMAIMVVFAVIRNMANKYVVGIFSGISNYNTAFRIYRESNVGSEWASVLLEIFSYIALSLFGYQLIKHQFLTVPHQGPLLIPFIFAAVGGFFMGKKFIHSTAGYLFLEKGVAREYVFNQNNSLKVAGILLFPLVALIEWAPMDSIRPIIIAGIFLLAIIYLLLLFRGINIFLQKQLSIFYLFLYLCTLEFLPILVVYKLLVA